MVEHGECGSECLTIELSSHHEHYESRQLRIPFSTSNRIESTDLNVNEVTIFIKISI